MVFSFQTRAGLCEGCRGVCADSVLAQAGLCSGLHRPMQEHAALTSEAARQGFWGNTADEGQPIEGQSWLLGQQRRRESVHEVIFHLCGEGGRFSYKIHELRPCAFCPEAPLFSARPLSHTSGGVRGV